MKKFTTILVLLLLVLVACGKESDGGTNNNDNTPGEVTEDVTIDFWTFWGSELRRPIIDRIIDDYNKDSEHITVEHTYNPYGDIWTKELAAISSGNPPDVVVNDINATAVRGERKRAEDLSPYLDDNYADNFFPHLWEAMEYDGGIYGIPFTTDTRVLFYNKDHFRDAGLDPDTPPKTWAELTEFADKLDKKDGNDFDVMGFYPLYNVGVDVWMINANGKNYLDLDGNIDLDNETNLEVIDWLLDRKNHYGKNTVEKFQSKVDGDQSHPFLTQELSMVAATGTFYLQIRDYAEDFDLGVALLPEFKEGTGNTSWGGGFVMEIPYGAKNPDASWDFIKYLSDNHAQVLWGGLNFDNVANIDASADVAEFDEFSDEDKAVYTVLDESLQHTILTPTPLMMPNYPEVVNPILDDIMLERISAKEGLEKAHKELEALKNEN